MKRETIPLYTRDFLPQGPWHPYRKVGYTTMLRIDGTFAVQTSEGIVTCTDGFLALDARGFPYPIAKDEHDQIYVECGDEIGPR